MSGSELEERIQDYLDERLSEPDRREFERRLASDVELARRIEAYRAASAALRAGSDELPPGFYTRLRARFETERLPSRRWSRLLSWEVAGLAAAVVIAGVLLAPFVLVPRPDGTVGERSTLSPSSSGPSGAESAAPRQRAVGKNERDQASEEAPATGRSGPERAPAPKTNAPALPEPELSPVPPPRTTPSLSESEKLRKAPAPSPKDAEEDRATSGESPRTDLGAEVGAAARSAPAAPARAPGVEQSAKADQLQESTPQMAASAFADADRAVPLGDGVVEAGRVVVISSREAWERIAQGSGEGSRERLGGFAPDRRLVLIGPRGYPLDCAGVRVVSTPEAYEIRIAATADRTGSEGGCALVLPRDGKPIRVIDISGIP